MVDNGFVCGGEIPVSRYVALPEIGARRAEALGAVRGVQS